MSKSLSSFVLPAVLAVVAGGLIGYYGTSQTHPVVGAEYCHTITDADADIPARYGSPFNFYGMIPLLSVSVLCSEHASGDGGTATVRVGTGSPYEYIYQYGFERVDGAWKRITLAGEDAVGPWFRGDAVATVLRDGDGLRQTNRIIVYTCNKVAFKWKCGCRDSTCATPYWQVQDFEFAEEPSIEPLEDSDESDMHYISSQSTYTGVVGTEVHLKGVGFSRSSNDVYFEEQRIASDIPSPDGKSLTFEVPEGIESGITHVYVDTDDGEKIQGFRFWVTTPGVPAPEVYSVSPREGSYGTEVTLRGKHFSPSNNHVLMGVDSLDGIVSPDGTTLTFRIEPGKDAVGDKASRGIPGADGVMPLYLIVSTEGGYTAEPVVFNLVP